MDTQSVSTACKLMTQLIHRAMYASNCQMKAGQIRYHLTRDLRHGPKPNKQKQQQQNCTLEGEEFEVSVGSFGVGVGVGGGGLFPVSG